MDRTLRMSGLAVMLPVAALVQEIRPNAPGNVVAGLQRHHHGLWGAARRPPGGADPVPHVFLEDFGKSGIGYEVRFRPDFERFSHLAGCRRLILTGSPY